MEEVCVIYARNSDPNTTSDAESFQNQEDVCQKYAKEKGYRVFKVYRESHTGSDLLNRVLVWDAVEDIRRGDATVLLVRDYDRLSREPVHMGVLEYEITEKNGGRIEAVLEPVDPNDDMAEVTHGILKVVAKVERKKIVRRLSNGKRRQAERGDLPGMANPLYGYAWECDEPKKRTSYTIDQQAADVIRHIFTLATSGYSLRSIAKQLNEDGTPTRAQHNQTRGHIGRRQVGNGWNAEQVRRIVSEREYTGDGASYRWQKAKSKKTGNMVTIPRPEDYPLRVKIAVPVIIDQATFDAANSSVKTREGDGRPPVDQEAGWLRGHIYCGVCHDRMYIKRTSEGHYKYECRNRKGRSTTDTYCAGGDFSIHTDTLDSDAYNGLLWAVTHLDILRERMLKKLGKDKIAVLTRMSEAFQVQLAEKREEYELARRRARQTKDDTVAADFTHDAEQLNGEIGALQKEYAGAREQLENFSSGATCVDAYIARIRANLPATLDLTEACIREMPLDVRRFLLEASGLVVKAFPTGYPKRTEVVFIWGTPAEQQEAINIMKKVSQSSAG